MGFEAFFAFFFFDGEEAVSPPFFRGRLFSLSSSSGWLWGELVLKVIDGESGRLESHDEMCNL